MHSAERTVHIEIRKQEEYLEYTVHTRKPDPSTQLPLLIFFFLSFVLRIAT